MGSSKWDYMPPSMGYKYAYPTYNSLITTHEPPGRALAEAKRVSKSWPERLLCVGTAFEDLGLERRGFLLIMLGLGGDIYYNHIKPYSNY